MYHHYLKEGQEYIKILLTQGKILSVELFLDLKAPVIIIPSNSLNNSTFLAVDLGLVGCITSKSAQNYEQYNFTLTNFGIFVVWQ